MKGAGLTNYAACTQPIILDSSAPNTIIIKIPYSYKFSKSIYMVHALFLMKIKMMEIYYVKHIHVLVGVTYKI